MFRASNQGKAIVLCLLLAAVLRAIIIHFIFA